VADQDVGDAAAHQATVLLTAALERGRIGGA
jgi:hypothetical protein